MYPNTANMQQIISKLANSTKSARAECVSGSPSFFMKYNCIGSPPLAEGVMALKKNPTDAYLNDDKNVILLLSVFSILLMFIPSHAI